MVPGASFDAVLLGVYLPASRSNEGQSPEGPNVFLAPVQIGAHPRTEVVVELVWAACWIAVVDLAFPEALPR